MKSVEEMKNSPCQHHIRICLHRIILSFLDRVTSTEHEVMQSRYLEGEQCVRFFPFCLFELFIDDNADCSSSLELSPGTSFKSLCHNRVILTLGHVSQVQHQRRRLKKNADAAEPLGDLGLTVCSLITQYLR